MEYMANEPEKLDSSKENDRRLVEFFYRNGRKRSRLATQHEDWVEKIDVWLEIVIDGSKRLVSVNTEYPGRLLNNMWYEVSDIGKRRCEKMLYCFDHAIVLDRNGLELSRTKDFHRCFLVDVEWLDRWALTHKDRWYKAEDDKKKNEKKELVDFNVLDAVKDGYAKEIDLNAVGFLKTT